MKDPKQTQVPIEDLSELRSYFLSHNVVREYIAHSSKVHSVGWSCDGKRLASGSFDKSVAIFNLERNRLVSILYFTAKLRFEVMFTTCFVHICCPFVNFQVQDFIFRGHTGSVDQLCWHASHPDLLSTASGDKSVRIWDTRYVG